MVFKRMDISGVIHFLYILPFREPVLHLPFNIPVRNVSVLYSPTTSDPGNRKKSQEIKVSLNLLSCFFIVNNRKSKNNESTRGLII